MKINNKQKQRLEEKIWKRYAREFEQKIGSPPFRTYQKLRLIRLTIEVMLEEFENLFRRN